MARPAVYKTDRLSGALSIIAGDRQGRPNRPNGECPFCVGGLEAPNTYDVLAFQNRWPTLMNGAATQTASEAQRAADRFDRHDTTPLSDDQISASSSRDVAIGTCEVVLYSPEHSQTMATLRHRQIEAVIELWADRTAALRSRPDTRHVLIFENSGRDVGATIAHPHGQIFAFAEEPPVLAAERHRSLNACAVCDELVAEDGGPRGVIANDSWSAFVPEGAGYPYEVRLSLRRHVAFLDLMDHAERSDLAWALSGLAGVYQSLFDTPMPYMMWLHQGLHTHVHFVPIWRSRGVQRYVAGGELGSGILINPVRPDDAAAALRRTEQGRTEQGRTEQGRTEQGRTEQGTTEQDGAKQGS
ncbi:MAG: hypothetical protein H6512_00315 [Acidimicrobiia bacterium]|nr:hypothetical protein [Acidimicrobiia bacterium]